MNIGRLKDAATWYWGCGPLIALTMAFFLSIASLSANFTEDDVPPFQFAFTTGALQALIMLCANSSLKIKPLFGETRVLGKVITISVFYGGFLVLFYAAVSFLPLLDALALFYLNPILAGIFGRVMFGDPFGGFSFLGLGVYMGGILALTQPPFIFEGTEWTSDRIMGMIFGVGSALSAGVAFTSVRGIRDQIEAPVMAFWVFVLMAVLSLIPFAVGWPDPPTFPKDPTVHLWLIAGSVAGAAGDVFACRACQHLPAGLVTVLESTQLIWGAIYGVLIFGESQGYLTVVGVLMLMLGIVLVSLDGNFEKLMDAIKSRNKKNEPKDLSSKLEIGDIEK